jgi:hypothetical protein
MRSSIFQYEDHIADTQPFDFTQLPTQRYEAITMRMLATVPPPDTTITGYPNRVACRIAALHHELPEDYIARLILRDQEEMKELAGLE